MILLTLYNKMPVKKCTYVKINARIFVKNIKCTEKAVFAHFQAVGSSSSKAEGMLPKIE